MKGASGEGRGRSRRALPLLSYLLFFPFFLFSSFAFSATSETVVDCGGFISTDGQTACSELASSLNSPDGAGYNGRSCADAEGAVYVICTTSSLSCVPPSGVPIATIGSSSVPNSNGVLPNTFCDPSSNCDTETVFTSAGVGGSLTNGQVCIATSATSSTSSSSTSCPPGYSLAAGSTCICTNSSGSFVDANGAATNPVCNGGTSTAPTLSPVAPVTSNGSTSCPAGSASVSSGSTVSCYAVVIPPPLASTSTPSSGGSSGGSGGNSTFHISAPTVSSNGQLTCPPGASTIGSGSSLQCITSGPPSSSTSPTASGSSGTSPTGSTASSPSYPTSFSMPSLGSSSVSVVPLAPLVSAQESTLQTCPSPVTFAVLGSTFSISFNYACQLAAEVRPVVIGVFSMASLLLLVK